MFTKILNEFSMSGLRKMFKSKSSQALEQVAEPMEPSTPTMETMKADPYVNVISSAKCICGVHRSEDEVEKEYAYKREEEEEEEEQEEKEEKEEVDERENMTLEEQIEMCGETFDQREARHQADEQGDISCLKCDELIWQARYDADKSLGKLCDGGPEGYLCQTCFDEEEEEEKESGEEEEKEEDGEE